MEMALPLARVSSRTLGATHVDKSAGELPLGWGLLHAWLLGAFWLRARWEPSLQGAFWEFSGSHLGARWQVVWKLSGSLSGKLLGNASREPLLALSWGQITWLEAAWGPARGPWNGNPPKGAGRLGKNPSVTVGRLGG